MNRTERDAPIVTLTTDFGVADHYAGTMKGVLLTQCPRVVPVDISHDVPAFSIVEGAYQLAQAWRYFPVGTVHLAVVDPGVGTERRPIAAEASGHYFVAPDNGLLTLALEGERYRAVEIVRGLDAQREISKTFHGRDVFAVVAGGLARGLPLSTFGEPLETLVSLPCLFETETAAGWEGTVMSVDRFGNAISNFKVARHRAMEQSPFSIDGGAAPVTKFRSTFGAAGKGELFAYFGSSGYIELGMNQERASDMLGLKAGDGVRLRMGAAGR